MLEFPEFKPPKEPSRKKMSLEEYIHFCDVCMKSNPRYAAGPFPVKAEREEIKEPFRL